MNPKVSELSEYFKTNEYYKTIPEPERFAEVLNDTYPTKDILAEVKKAYLWQFANEKRRKKNQKRFLTNWMARAFTSSSSKLCYYKPL